MKKRFMLLMSLMIMVSLSITSISAKDEGLIFELSLSEGSYLNLTVNVDGENKEYQITPTTDMTYQEIKIEVPKGVDSITYTIDPRVSFTCDNSKWSESYLNVIIPRVSYEVSTNNNAYESYQIDDVISQGINTSTYTFTFDDSLMNDLDGENKHAQITATPNMFAYKIIVTQKGDEVIKDKEKADENKINTGDSTNLSLVAGILVSSGIICIGVMRQLKNNK